MRNIAQAGGHRLTERAAAHTPVRTGTLASKWRSLDVTPAAEEGINGWTSGTENPDYRARWIEHGVEPHEIRPRRAEALDTPEGPRGGVEHPGHPGAHMLAQAAQEVELVLGEIAQPHLWRWAAQSERLAKRHFGIH